MNSDTASAVLTVSAFNRLVQQTLQGGIALTWIAGEISNLTRAASGHWYFSLKDAAAQVRCVMFRGRNQFVDWQPENGMQVEVRATAGLYEPRGEFQLQVDTLRRAGLGILFEAFERLKRTLQHEGLFDASRKRAIPAMPRRLGIVTSPQAAALQDVLSTLRRQMPSLPIVLYPCSVQGAAAAAQIVAALDEAYRRAECDVLIVCRGGGSIEDLWPFNEEIVARAIAASPVPVISGVGHETDFTITDFVADLRAPTPTAAAVLASAHHQQLEQALDSLQLRFSRHISQSLSRLYQHIGRLGERLVHPGRRLSAQMSLLNQFASRLRNNYRHLEQRRLWQQAQMLQRLQRQMPRPVRYRDAALLLQNRLQRAMHSRLEQYRTAIRHVEEQLQHLNPMAVLERGYSVVRNEAGVVIRDADQTVTGEKLHLQFASGSADAQIRKRYPAQRLKK
ncbi:MAG TPA: exodeoxyribonuclease VII large subunit [Burkholderiales bacterium]|nr:exodeoxyribonuclease VII large subunit [Burkholderiales bacterium]